MGESDIFIDPSLTLSGSTLTGTVFCMGNTATLNPGYSNLSPILISAQQSRHQIQLLHPDD